jgi:hypothetical protein
VRSSCELANARAKQKLLGFCSAAAVVAISGLEPRALRACSGSSWRPEAVPVAMDCTAIAGCTYYNCP